MHLPMDLLLSTKIFICTTKSQSSAPRGDKSKKSYFFRFTLFSKTARCFLLHNPVECRILYLVMYIFILQENFNFYEKSTNLCTVWTHRQKFAFFSFYSFLQNNSLQKLVQSCTVMNSASFDVLRLYLSQCSFLRKNSNTYAVDA